MLLLQLQPNDGIDAESVALENIMLQFAELATRAHVVEAHEREGQGRSSPNCTQKGVPVVAARKRAGAGGDFVAQHEHLFVVLVERIEERRRLRQVAKVIAWTRGGGGGTVGGGWGLAPGSGERKGAARGGVGGGSGSPASDST